VKCQVTTNAVRALPTSPMVRRDMSLDDDQRNFVARVLDRTKWTVTELARRAELDHSTLSRFMNGGREGHVMRHSSIRKIERASGISFLPTPDPTGLPTGRAPKAAHGFGEVEATPYAFNSANPDNALVEAAIGGRNDCEAWVLRSRALEAIGFRPGDIVVVLASATILTGDIVCARIFDYSKGVADTVFRLYQPGMLLPMTGDERLMRPYSVDDSAVTIAGVVTTTLRSRTGR
jgi:transcriptional regulator with XRE-family HTH domain